MTPNAAPNVAPPARSVASLQERLLPLTRRLASHPLYRSFRTLEDLHLFMESHVFAVWDFMSLLKSLQRGLTCVDTPWLPTPHAGTRRLINEIVLGEESDTYRGEPASHFELYLRAMRESGASTTAIDALIRHLRQGTTLEAALQNPEIPSAARRFVQSTFAIIGSGHLPAIAAAFTFSREDLIPEMFRGFLRDQDMRLEGKLELFRWYLDRHIEVDGEEHGPMALQMVRELCGDDPDRWKSAERAATAALEARLELWDAITASLQGNRDATT